MRAIYDAIFSGWLADAEFALSCGNENATFPPTYEEWISSLSPEEIRELEEEWA